MNPIGILLIAIGAFSLSGAYFDWEWFMNSRKARIIVMIFTRSGARIFYALLGVTLVTLGVLALTGIIEMSK